MIDYGKHLHIDQLRYLVEKYTCWSGSFAGVTKEELINELDLHFKIKRIR